jgi:hypothetical protein
MKGTNFGSFSDAKFLAFITTNGINPLLSIEMLFGEAKKGNFLPRLHRYPLWVHSGTQQCEGIAKTVHKHW